MQDCNTVEGEIGELGATMIQGETVRIPQIEEPLFYRETVRVPIQKMMKLTSTSPVKTAFHVSEIRQSANIVDVHLNVSDNLFCPIFHEMVYQNESFRDCPPVSRRRFNGFPHQSHYGGVSVSGEGDGGCQYL